MFAGPALAQVFGVLLLCGVGSGFVERVKFVTIFVENGINLSSPLIVYIFLFFALGQGELGNNKHSYFNNSPKIN